MSGGKAVKRKRNETLTGPRDGRTQNKKTGQAEAIAARQAKAIELRKSGASYRAIGRVLGCSEATAHRDVRKALRRIIAFGDRQAEEYRQLELERLDAIQLGVWLRMRTGDPHAADVARKVSESRRKLLGLDAPTKVAPTNPAGDKPYEGVDLSKLSEDTLRKIIQELGG